MKVLKDSGSKNGRRQLVIELEDSETLLPVRDGAFYQLGGQVEDIVASHVLTEAAPVTWCSIQQTWVSA